MQICTRYTKTLCHHSSLLIRFLWCVKTKYYIFCKKSLTLLMHLDLLLFHYKWCKFKSLHVKQNCLWGIEHDNILTSPPGKFAVLKITELDGNIGCLDKQYYLSCTVNEDQVQIDLSSVSTNWVQFPEMENQSSSLETLCSMNLYQAYVIQLCCLQESGHGGWVSRNQVGATPNGARTLTCCGSCE